MFSMDNYDNKLLTIKHCLSDNLCIRLFCLLEKRQPFHNITNIVNFLTYLKVVHELSIFVLTSRALKTSAFGGFRPQIMCY